MRLSQTTTWRKVEDVHYERRGACTSICQRARELHDACERRLWHAKHTAQKQQCTWRWHAADERFIQCFATIIQYFRLQHRRCLYPPLWGVYADNRRACSICARYRAAKTIAAPRSMSGGSASQQRRQAILSCWFLPHRSLARSCAHAPKHFQTHMLPLRCACLRDIYAYRCPYAPCVIYYVRAETSLSRGSLA